MEVIEQTLMNEDRVGERAPPGAEHRLLTAGN
jgi:hypothetical protein